MTPRLLALAAAALATMAATLGAAPQTPQQKPTVFRATADLVTVDVTVRAGGTPVAGLAADDFLLHDNGVRQKIEGISMAAVPVDVSILVDNNEDVDDDLDGMAGQLHRIAALLRPTDRLRVTTINSSVVDLVPATPAARAELPARLTAAGLSSAHDGLIAALLRRVEPNRPHLVVALTNGIDAVSSVDAAAVRDVARRSPAMLYIVQVDVALENERPPLIYNSGRQREEDHRCATAGLCSPTRRFWVPYDDHDFDTLREAAESTGGAMYLPGVFTDRSAAAIFRKVFEDYRRSYLLRYVPQGVAREGWHELTVTIPRYPGYTVHARRGYAIDPPPRAAARSSSSDLPADGAAALIAAYDRPDGDAFAAGLRRVPDLARLIQRLRDGGTPWPANPRREAAFVIELAHAAVFSRRGADRLAGRQLLAAHEALVRPALGPDPFERYWRWAALAVLQGANAPDAAQPFVDRALARFPDEPRFVLARAFLADQRRPLGPVPPAHAADVLTLYDAAIGLPEARAEALIRKAWLLHRIGRDAEALHLLDAARDAPDGTLRYLGQFHRAQVLEALARPDAAIDAYEAALAIAPDAQSPKVALMALRLKQGDRRGAAALAAAIETAPAGAWDPAWAYWLGDYRSYDEIVRRLREQTR
jgi:VWFA-related protein